MKYKAIVVQKTNYWSNSSLNKEVWLFPDRVDFTDLWIKWQENKEEFPQFKHYLEFIGGEEIQFGNILIN